ncbi:hypothetical protein F4775DRAFT_5501 [Biscogniauxia sp. FL1348]|nr:hypothetical protein F4775DRAFT_5501 [Biscogniauxia sp. FL1348]
MIHISLVRSAFTKYILSLITRARCIYIYIQMVGVPGRSKACNTCRRRRVRCDETKPLCRRCVKGGFECLGYERPTQWRHTSTAPLPLSDAPSSGAKPGPAALVSTVVSPARQIDLAAFREDMCVAYMSRNFVWRSYGTLWLDQAAAGKLGYLSLQATNALSQLSFGLHHRMREVECMGASLYGKCLRILAEELGKGPAMARRGRELIIPILVLMMLASIQRDKIAAVFHLKAVAKVLLLCGPEEFQRQPLRNAFEAARCTLLTASLFSRRRLFLEDERWQSIPWALDPSEKSPQSHLTDIFLVIPGLLEDHSRIGSPGLVSYDESTDPYLHPNKHSISHAALRDRVLNQLEKLYHWRWDWQYRYGRHVTVDPSGWCSNSAATKALGSTSDPRMPGRLHFSRSACANDITLYNAALMWLLSLLWKLEPFQAASLIEGCAQRAAPSSNHPQHPSSHHIGGAQVPLPQYTPFEPLRRPGSSVSIRDPAMEICRVYEWQSRHHDQHAASGDQTCLYLFPVGMARAVLDTDADGRRWIKAMLASSPVTAGYGEEGGSVAGFSFYITKNAMDPNVHRGGKRGHV